MAVPFSLPRLDAGGRLHARFVLGSLRGPGQMASGRYPRQREYPHPPPPSRNRTRRTINMVDISHLILHSMHCSLGTNAECTPTDGGNPRRLQGTMCRCCRPRGKKCGSSDEKRVEARRRTGGRVAVRSCGANTGEGRQRIVQPAVRTQSRRARVAADSGTRVDREHRSRPALRSNPQSRRDVSK
jgi:hypothetical protein